MNIIICGANHSGTSAIAKLLVDNGYDPGKYDNRKTDVCPYIKYESAYFSNYCIAAIEKRTSITKDKEKLLNSLTNKSVLKWPKSALILNHLSFIPDQKVIFVTRNPNEIIISTMKKTNLKQRAIFDYISKTYEAIKNFKGNILTVTYENYSEKQILEYCK